MSGAKLYIHRVVTPDVGTRGILLRLPVSGQLKHVTMGNGTTPFQHLTMYLVPTSFTLPVGSITTDNIPGDRVALKYGQQGGVNQGMEWTGNILLSADYAQLMGLFYGLVVFDSISLRAVVEGD